MQQTVAQKANLSQGSIAQGKDISFEATLVKIASNHPTTTKLRALGEIARHEQDASIAGRTTKCTDAAGGVSQMSKPAYSVQRTSKKPARYQQPAQTLTEISAYFTSLIYSIECILCSIVISMECLPALRNSSYPPKSDIE